MHPPTEKSLLTQVSLAVIDPYAETLEPTIKPEAIETLDPIVMGELTDGMTPDEAEIDDPTFK
jgi:hypothetical protein